MRKLEAYFWKIITEFGELPGILVPLGLVAGHILHWINRHWSIIDWGQPLTTQIDETIMMSIIVGYGGVFCSYLIGTIIKGLHYKPRPVPRDTSTLWKRITAGSMPSIHTSNSLICATAMILSVSALDSLTTYWFVAAVMFGFLYYLSVSLSRIALDHHYPLDVLAGSILGMIIVSAMRVLYPWITALIDYIIILSL